MFAAMANRRELKNKMRAAKKKHDDILRWLSETNDKDEIRELTVILTETWEYWDNIALELIKASKPKKCLWLCQEAPENGRARELAFTIACA